MRKTYSRLVLASFAALLAACNSSKPGSSRVPAAKSESPSVPGKHLTMLPDPKVVAEHCVDGPGASLLTAMKDSSGHIGGYVFRRAIRDSPIFYLDPAGKHVAIFHIFGPPEEKQANGPRIDSLRAVYPVEEDIKCP